MNGKKLAAAFLFMVALVPGAMTEASNPGPVPECGPGAPVGCYPVLATAEPEITVVPLAPAKRYCQSEADILCWPKVGK